METTNSSADVICVAVYMNRKRDSVCDKYYFVGITDTRGIAWYIEPFSDQCSEPDDVIRIHSIPNEDVLFGGELTRRALVELDYFKEIMVDAFGKNQPHAPELPLFVDAEVIIASKGLGVTVRNVINSSKGFH